MTSDGGPPLDPDMLTDGVTIWASPALITDAARPDLGTVAASSSGFANSSSIRKPGWSCSPRPPGPLPTAESACDWKQDPERGCVSGVCVGRSMTSYRWYRVVVDLWPAR
jgi:hypothetical protein